MRIRVGKWELRIWLRRRPQLLRRVASPKSQPPLNYDPEGIWHDYFDLKKRDKTTTRH